MLPPLLLLLVLALQAGALATPKAEQAMWAEPTAPPVVDDSDEYSALPDDFLFGAGSSAIQTEGAATEDGKSQSVISYMIDHSAELNSPLLPREQPGEATDSYHRYKEDVEMAAKLKLQVYRFSVDWSRLFPDGDINNPNDKAVQFYNNMINELVKNRIQPMVSEDDHHGIGVRRELEHATHGTFRRSP